MHSDEEKEKLIPVEDKILSEVKISFILLPKIYKDIKNKILPELDMKEIPSVIKNSIKKYLLLLLFCSDYF